MKKYFSVFVALLALVITSCNNDDVVVEKDIVNVTVHLTVDNGFELTNTNI